MVVGAGVPVVVPPLFPQYVGGRDDALTEGSALHAGDVLLAHALAGLTGRVRLAGRCLLHRDDALRERSRRAAGGVLLALLAAELAKRCALACELLCEPCLPLFG